MKNGMDSYTKTVSPLRVACGQWRFHKGNLVMKTINLKDIFIEALSLPGKPRAALAHNLLASLKAKRQTPKQVQSRISRRDSGKIMSRIAQRVCGKTLKLPPTAREELARRLILSIEDEDYDNNANESWHKEIVHRLRAVGCGKAKLIPASEAMRRAYSAIE